MNEATIKQVMGVLTAAYPALGIETIEEVHAALKARVDPLVVVRWGEFEDRIPASEVRYETLERRLIEGALKAYGNQTQAARALGITRDQLRYRIAAYKAGIRKGGATVTTIGGAGA